MSLGIAVLKRARAAQKARGWRTKRSVSGSQNGSILESGFDYNFQVILGPVLLRISAPFGSQKLIFRESFSSSILNQFSSDIGYHFGLHFGSISEENLMRRGKLTFQNRWFYIGKTSVFGIGRLPQRRKKRKGWNPKTKHF